MCRFKRQNIPDKQNPKNNTKDNLPPPSPLKAYFIPHYHCESKFGRKKPNTYIYISLHFVLLCLAYPDL